jgi:hypothetical protein
MKTRRWILLAGLLVFSGLKLCAQRSYAAHSVLSSGRWYQVSVKEAGMYRVDLALLQTLGVQVSGLSSASIRLFGAPGRMLPEANAAPHTDDLKEIPIMMIDGGDGQFNGSDYFIFYAAGPHEWLKDSANATFRHRLNLYSDRAFFYIQVGGTGLRIANAPAATNPNVQVRTYSAREFHEWDTVNFLSGSREWYGEEFADAPGKTLQRTFNFSMPAVNAGNTVRARASLLSRSVGAGSRFDILINGQPAGQCAIAPVNGGQYDPVAVEQMVNVNGIGVGGGQQVRVQYVPGSFNAQGWLNWIEIFSTAGLSFSGRGQFGFRDWQSVNGGMGEFIIGESSSQAMVWDVTDPLSPLNIPGNHVSGEFRFVRHLDRLREYVAFLPNSFLSPQPVGHIKNQDLHGLGPASFLIVSHHLLRGEAQRLGEIHLQREGLSYIVATPVEIYNEFSGGIPDPTAIRDFVKMFYDRHGADPQTRPRYLLLLGDASFDYRARIFQGENFVPPYENDFPLDPLNTYPSDDFFGFLDDHEDISSGLVTNLLDIGIGRVPASGIEQARDYVDKVEDYYNAKSFGPWRTQLSFIADDEDNNLHVQDAEQFNSTAAANEIFNRQKIYLDAYAQETGPGGSAYPGATQASNNRVQHGTLVWNYTGHGGPHRLAEETVLDRQAVESWQNEYRLPLFVTATCDFAPYDQPAATSLGEEILLRKKTGAIALMTTTRLVFSFSNRLMNDEYLRVALNHDGQGNYPSLGEAVRVTKNHIYQSTGDISNNRKFTLLGDPALTLGFPKYRVRIISVNGIPSSSMDTISAVEEVWMQGEVLDWNNNRLNQFNGTVYPTVFDKRRTLHTRGNDPGSQPMPFEIQSNQLFRGKASVQDGMFTFRFKVPKDIGPGFGRARVSVYAENQVYDAAGVFDNVMVGGLAAVPSNDVTGPQLRAFLNDEMFVNGSIVNETPLLIVKLTDTSGINTTGLGIGHDLVATLDDDNRQYFVLNEYYVSETDDFTKGSLRFQLPRLAPGPHSLLIRAWDGMNNSSEYRVEFVVASDEEMELAHVLNYPNPFSTQTRFWFEHNKPGIPLAVHLQIMTITGRVVKTFSGQVTTPGNRFAGFDWDGRDEFGDRLGRGVYIYQLQVTDPKGKKARVLEKLFIF